MKNIPLPHLISSKKLPLLKYHISYSIKFPGDNVTDYLILEGTPHRFLKLPVTGHSL